MNAIASIRTALPWGLVGLRLCLAPAIIFTSVHHSQGAVIAGLMSAAFLSDIFDGVLARRFGVATPLIRRADSLVDVLFYTCVAIALRLERPDIWGRWWPLLVGFLALEAIVQTIHFSRFHRPAAVHAYSSKLLGIALFVAATALLGGAADGTLWWVTLCFGAFAYLELLAVVLISPSLPLDVRTISDLRRAHAVAG